MRTSAVLPVAALLSMLAAVVPGVPAVRGDKPPLRLTIAFTGDVSGYLEPCG